MTKKVALLIVVLTASVLTGSEAKLPRFVAKGQENGKPHPILKDLEDSLPDGFSPLENELDEDLTLMPAYNPKEANDLISIESFMGGL